MAKIKRVLGIVIIPALALALAVSLLMAMGCASSFRQGLKVVSKEDSQKIAEDFVRNSPTFRFDGIDDTLKLISSEGEGKTSRWEFHYEFQSRQAGYGDRTGLISAQVITGHKAQIVVEQGEVVHAVLDGKWDMIRQRMLEKVLENS